MSDIAHGNFHGKRLVVFGCGYVGTAVARQAVARGMRVTALTRNTAKAAALAEQGVETVVADLAEGDWHHRIAGGAEFVLNCVSSGGGGIEGYRRSYVEGMNSVLIWAKSRGAPGTLIYTSSTSVYPQDTGAQVIETSPTDGAGERAALLLEAERLLRECDRACERWFILRLAGIYGPGRHQLLDQLRAGEILGRANQRLNLIHCDDICAAIWAAFAAPPSITNEILNVADNGAAQKSEITAWLAVRLGLPAPRFSGLASVAARRPGSPDRIISNEKIRRLLGWQPACPTFRVGYEKILSR